MARGRSRQPPPAPQSLVQMPRALIEAEIRRRQEAGLIAVTSASDAMARMPLRQFYEAAWPIVDPVKFLPNWHIDAVAEHLTAVSDKKIEKLIINVPPGSAKSLMTSVLFPAWHWGPNGHPETRFLCTAHSFDGVAERDAQKNRALIEHEWYQREWGTVFQLLADQNTKDLFKNDKHGYRVSSGIETVAGQRADIVIIDDPTNPAESKMATMSALQKAIDSWELSLRTRALDVGSAVILIMQRIHMEDLTGYFLREDGWTHLRLPAHLEKDNICRVFLDGKLFFEDPRTEEGEYIHPTRTKAAEEAEAIRLSDAWVYAGQMQQRPVPVEGGIIKIPWVQHYGDGEAFQLSDIIDEYIITVDCAFKDQEDNSWVVMQCWARRMADAYLVDQKRGHFDLPTTMSELVMFCEKHAYAAGKYVESKANGVGVVQMLKGAVPGLLGSDDDDGIIKSPKVAGQAARKPSNLCLKKFCAMSKEAKLSAVAPYFQARNVYIPSKEVLDDNGEKWVKEYVYELTNFPKVRFNDQVDCTSMGVWKLLSSFVAHISASDVLQDLGVAINVGAMEKAYGEDRDKTSVGEMGNLAFGYGGGFGNLGRDAFGGG